MAYVAKGKLLEQEVGEGPKSHKIRITLTSQDVTALEKGEPSSVPPERAGHARPSAGGRLLRSDLGFRAAARQVALRHALPPRSGAPHHAARSAQAHTRLHASGVAPNAVSLAPCRIRRPLA